MRVLFTLPGFNRARTFRLASLLSFVGCARVASGYGAKPCRVMCPSPFVGHCSIGHSAKRAGHRGCAFVDMNDETCEHEQRGEIMYNVTHGDDPSRHDMV